MSEQPPMCMRCKKPITDGLMTGMLGGLSHVHCALRERPPQTAQNLFEVARGVGGDPVLAAKVIADLVPEDVAAEIVRTYNRRLLLQWEKRCEEPT